MNSSTDLEQHPSGFNVGDRVTLSHDPARSADVIGFDTDTDTTVRVRWEGVTYDRFHTHDTVPALLLRWTGQAGERSRVEQLTAELAATVDDTREEYSAFLARYQTQAPSLQEYSDWSRHDPNLPWRLDVGHLVNLLDAALERIDELTTSSPARTVSGGVESPH